MGTMRKGFVPRETRFSARQPADRQVITTYTTRNSVLCDSHLAQAAIVLSRGQSCLVVPKKIYFCSLAAQ